MLNRDKYKEDFCLKYHPNLTMLSFVQTYSGTNPSLAPHLPENVNSIKKNNYISVLGSSSLFLTGIAASIFYKRIPWINTFTSSYSRMLWSIFFILMPSGIFSGIWNTYAQLDLQTKFQNNKNDFASYLASKDITKLNDNIRLCDD